MRICFGLVIGLLLVEFVRADGLDVLVAGLDDARVGNLVIDLPANFDDGLIREEVLGPVEQVLVLLIPLVVDGPGVGFGVGGRKLLEAGQQAVPDDAAEVDFLRLADGGEQVLPRHVIGDIRHGLDEILGGQKYLNRCHISYCTFVSVVVSRVYGRIVSTGAP